jgi:hypothetical protein
LRDSIPRSTSSSLWGLWGQRQFLYLPYIDQTTSFFTGFSDTVPGIFGFRMQAVWHLCT